MNVVVADLLIYVGHKIDLSKEALWKSIYRQI